VIAGVHSIRRRARDRLMLIYNHFGLAARCKTLVALATHSDGVATYRTELRLD
jgi:hypothetical protein